MVANNPTANPILNLIINTMAAWGVNPMMHPIVNPMGWPHDNEANQKSWEQWLGSLVGGPGAGLGCQPIVEVLSQLVEETIKRIRAQLDTWDGTEPSSGASDLAQMLGLFALPFANNDMVRQNQKHFLEAYVQLLETYLSLLKSLQSSAQEADAERVSKVDIL